MGKYFYNQMPNSSAFDTPLQKDMLTVYPKDTFGNFTQLYGLNMTQQFVSVSDFGRGPVNTTGLYQASYDNQVLIGKNNFYFYTPQTDPIVSGMADLVAPVLDTMTGNLTNSSYDQYSDLIDQLALHGMTEAGSTLEVVGTNPPLNFSDRYYAGIKPNNDVNNTYTFQAVMHLNQTLTNDEMERLSLIPDAMKQSANYTSYNITYGNAQPGDYLVVSAVGPFDEITNDMMYYSNIWPFMRY